MKNLRKIVSLLLCVCMLLGMTALAEEAAPAAETVETAEAAAPVELAADDLLATVNGEQLTWGDVESIYNTLLTQYSSYYDVTAPENVELFRAIAMDNAIVEMLLMQKAVEFGLAELTAEEIAALEATALADWEGGIQNYLDYIYPEYATEATEEQLTAAREEAIAYYNANGYSPESLTDNYKRYSVMDKVQAMMLQDVTVTDEEVEELYQSLVAADKELYENDIAAYVAYNNQVDMMAYYAMMYGSASEMDYAWYRPEGFRAVKHILLPVDETLMAAYTDLQARFEEQQSDAAAAAEETTEEAAAETEPSEPVTAEQVNEAKAAVLASLADKIDEIMQKVNEGVDFDELIATYGVDAEGNPSDPGMANEPTKTTGYEVSAASSNYVPEFVEASMSIAEVGGVSAPYLSDYGIHIVKYIGDVPGGPIEMTDAQREAKRASLLYTKQNEKYVSTMESWLAESAIEYTGVVIDVNTLQAAQ